MKKALRKAFADAALLVAGVYALGGLTWLKLARQLRGPVPPAPPQPPTPPSSSCRCPTPEARHYHEEVCARLGVPIDPIHCFPPSLDDQVAALKASLEQVFGPGRVKVIPLRSADSGVDLICECSDCVAVRARRAN